MNGALTLRDMLRLNVMPRLWSAPAAAALFALTSLAAVAVPVADPPAASATVPMVDCDGFACVELTFPGGVHGRFAIDTGDATSILDTAFAKSLHAELKPYVGRDGKERPGVSVATIGNATLSSLPLGDVKYAVVELNANLSGGQAFHIDGTIGLPALANRLLTVDYPGHTVTLSPPLTAPVTCPSFCGDLANITFGKAGPPILVATSGFSVNGKPVSLQVDLLYSGSIVIYDASLEKLGLADLAHSTTAKDHFPHTDGGVDMLRASAASQNFGTLTLAKDGPLYFALPGVHQPDGLFDGTVGAALLAKSRVTLDFFDHKIWIG
jgi:hypothetical protein